MAFVVTAGQLSSVVRPLPLPALPVTGMRLSDDLYADYAAIWRAQPQVRTVVGFLARNIAQLGLHCFRRVSDVDRERLTDHPVARLFARPNPTLTTYRLFATLVSDMAIYDCAFWVKVRGEGGLLGLIPIPPNRVTPNGGNWLNTESFVIRQDYNKTITLPADQVVHFRGYNPVDPRSGDSPLNSLRSLLLEEYESNRQRQAMWRNGARMSGIITRPLDAPQWSDTARERFTSSWRSSYTGSGGDVGGTPMLEDGMTFASIGMNSEQAQYVQTRKLTREEVSCAYWIPPPMVGILEHATFSNITEQHKMLYQDCLGPWTVGIQQEIALQVLPDIEDSEDVYVEFNVAEKLKGSFEEQATAASTSTGRPWMTVNEQRARFNLPQHPDGDGLVVPLNVMVGGLASPTDTAPPKAIAATAERIEPRPSAPEPDEDEPESP